MSDVTIHPHPANDIEHVYEYPLMSKELTSEIVTGLPPWIQSFCGVDTERAIELLASRWNGITDPSVRALSSAILDEYHPVSICIGKGFVGDCGFALLLERNSQPKTGSSVRDLSTVLLIPPPCERAVIERELARVGFGEHHVLLEFLEAFGGMKEGYPPTPAFFTPADRLGIMERPDLPRCIPLDWRSSLFLFFDGAEQTLWLHPTDAVAWDEFGGPHIVVKWDSLDEFIRYCAGCRQDGRHLGS